MEWSARVPAPLTIGDVRTVRKFLLLPKCLDGKWRWLESAWIDQRVVLRTAAGTSPWERFTYLGWIDVQWAAR